MISPDIKLWMYNVNDLMIYVDRINNDHIIYRNLVCMLIGNDKHVPSNPNGVEQLGIQTPDSKKASWNKLKNVSPN